MNRTPVTVLQYYSTEADARGGRFTRKCVKVTDRANAPKWSQNPEGKSVDDPNAYGPWWCTMGPLMRGSEMAEALPWEPVTIAGGRNGEAWGNFELNLNSNASLDDVLAWAFAARWWSNYCWQMYDQAIKVAPGISKGDAPGIKLSVKNWPKDGPADPRFAPNRDIIGKGMNIGGTQFLGGMYVLDSTWPLYFGSLNAQIVAKALTSNVLDLILIQIVLKHCGLFFKSCLNPAADPDILKLLNPEEKL